MSLLLRVHLYDLATGNYLATVPMVDRVFGDALNGTGSFQGTLDLSDPAIQAMSPFTVTAPGKAVACIEAKGISQPIGAYMIGLPRTRHMGPDGYKLKFSGRSMWWWFTKRVQAVDYSNPPFSNPLLPSTAMPYWKQQPYGADAIAYQVIYDAIKYAIYGQNTVPNTNPMGSPGLTIKVNGSAWTGASVITSGYWISPSFPYSSVVTLDNILQQITQLSYEVGVDVSFDVSWATAGEPQSGIVGVANIWYPRKGRIASSSQVTIDLTRARTYDFDEDADPMGAAIYETGVTGALAIDINLSPIGSGGGGGYALQEVVLSQSNLQGNSVLPSSATGALGLLTQLAANETVMSSYPIFSGTAVLPLDGMDPQVGSFSVGDDIFLYSPTVPVFPNGLNNPTPELRLAAWEITAPEQGDQTIKVTLNAPPTTTQPSGPTIDD